MKNFFSNTYLKFIPLDQFEFEEVYRILRYWYDTSNELKLPLNNQVLIPMTISYRTSEIMGYYEIEVDFKWFDYLHEGTEQFIMRYDTFLGWLREKEIIDIFY